MGKRTRKRDLLATKRSKLALEMRTAGHDLQEIADACGYADRSGAYYAVQRELERFPEESVGELRRVEHIRLERLVRAVWPLAVPEALESLEEEEGEETDEPKTKQKVSLFAVDRLIALSERHSKLMGLDKSADGATTAQNYTKRIIIETNAPMIAEEKS